MNKILIAVDGTKGSAIAVEKFIGMLSWCHPETLVLLHVEKYSASFLMDEMAGDSELSALKEALQGTEYQEMLDKKAQKILDHYKKSLEDKGVDDIKTLAVIGHPAEVILDIAGKEGVDMIVLGSRGNRYRPLMMGSVSREVADNALIPVLLIK